MLLTLVLALLCAVVLLWRTQISEFFWLALRPVMSARDSLSDSKVKDLQAELASTTATLADRDRLAAENRQLKSLLGRTDTQSFILAGVIGKPPGMPYDTLLLDIGESSGVRSGGDVYIGSVDVGTISEVGSRTARAILFSSPGEVHEALIQGTIPISLEGQGAGSMKGQVPAGTDIKVGSFAAFPGIQGGYVGKVAYVEQKEGSSFKTIYVQTPINPFETSFVLVKISP